MQGPQEWQQHATSTSAMRVGSPPTAALQQEQQPSSIRPWSPVMHMEHPSTAAGASPSPMHPPSPLLLPTASHPPRSSLEVKILSTTHPNHFNLMRASDSSPDTSHHFDEGGRQYAGGKEKLLGSSGSGSPSTSRTGSATAAAHSAALLPSRLYRLLSPYCPSRIPAPATVGKWLLAAVAVVLVLLLAHKLSDPANLQYVQDYAVMHPARVVPLFMLANALAPLILLPSAPFQILAGAVWGMSRGLLISFVATLAANLSAFCIGRHLLQATLSSFITSKVASFPAIQAAILAEGWRLVLMLRVSPILPDSLMNYTLSLTNVSLGLFAAVTITAMVPWVSLYVYLGVTSKNIVGGGGTDGGGTAGGTTWVNLAVLLVSAVTAVAAVVYLGRVIRKAISRAGGISSAAAGVLPGTGGTCEGEGEETEAVPLLLHTAPAK